MLSYRNVWVAASLGATVLLAACGGGGGGGTAGPVYDGATSDVVFTADNAKGIATDVAEMALAPIDVPITGADLLYSRSNESSKSSSRARDVRTFRQKAETFLKDRLEAERSRLSSMGIRATESESLECDSGTGTGTATFSNELAFTAGDSITMSFNNCESVYDGEILNGSLTMTIKEWTGTKMSFAFSFNNFQIKETLTGDSMLMHGDYTMTTVFSGSITSMQLISTSLLVKEVYQQRESSMLLTDMNQSDTYDSALASHTYRANFTAVDSSFGGKITVKTLKDFVVTLSGVTQGEMIITGAKGAKIRLTPDSGFYLLVEYDLDGDGSYGDQAPDTLAL